MTCQEINDRCNIWRKTKKIRTPSSNFLQFQETHSWNKRMFTLIKTTKMMSSNKRKLEIFESSSINNTNNSKLKDTKNVVPSNIKCTNLLNTNEICHSNFNIDALLYHTFHVNVCQSCKHEFSNKYSLISKAEIKNNYLLTDDCIDTHLKNFTTKENPLNTHYKPMKLYLLKDVIEIANKKWNSDNPNGLLVEKNRRESLKFKKQLSEIESLSKQILDNEHEEVGSVEIKNVETIKNSNTKLKKKKARYGCLMDAVAAIQGK